MQKQVVAKYTNLGVAQNSKARVSQVSVFGSIYQGAMLVHVLEQPFDGWACSMLAMDLTWPVLRKLSVWSVCPPPPLSP